MGRAATETHAAAEQHHSGTVRFLDPGASVRRHGLQCRGNGRVETCDARLLRTDTGMTKGNW